MLKKIISIAALFGYINCNAMSESDTTKLKAIILGSFKNKQAADLAQYVNNNKNLKLNKKDYQSLTEYTREQAKSCYDKLCKSWQEKTTGDVEYYEQEAEIRNIQKSLSEQLDILSN